MMKTIGYSSSPPIRHTTSLLTNTLRCDSRHSCTGVFFAAILWQSRAIWNRKFELNEKSKSHTNAAARQRLFSSNAFSKLSQQRVASRVSHGHLTMVGRFPCAEQRDRRHHCEVPSKVRCNMETAIEPAEESTNNSFTASNRFSHSLSTTVMF